MSEPSPFPPGTVVADRYRVVGTLGGGGMGLVFEVEHIGLGRHFALKVLRLGRFGEELIQRFQREARALARLHTPRIAQVTDFGVDPQAGPYYVMELVDGETLEQRLERGALPLDEAVTVAVELAEALADVHAAGLVHRDLKPGNIGLTTGPIPVRLLDFGLAASVDDRFLERITRSQQILGSMPYMSPEQFAGARPAPTQDLWALGIVLFEMVTGAMPFEAPSSAALMHQILTAPVPTFGQQGLAVPPALEGVLEALLRREPDLRIGSARAASEMLTTLRGSAPIAPTVATAAAFPPTRAMPSGIGSQPQRAIAPDAATDQGPWPRSASSTTVPPATGTSPTPRGGPSLGLLLGAGVVMAVVSGLTISTALHFFESRDVDPAAASPGLSPPIPAPSVPEPAPPAPDPEAAPPDPEAAPDQDAGADAAVDAEVEAEVTPAATRSRPAAAMRRRRRSNETPSPATMAAPPSTPGEAEGDWTGFIIEDPE